MALFATRACILAGAHRVALPALFVNDDLRAERFIRNVDWTGGMALRTGVNVLIDLAGFIMADLTIDPG